MAQDLMPKRPGIWPLLDKIKFLLMIALPRIGIILRNRKSIVDPRTIAVSILHFFIGRDVLISSRWQFIKRVREQRKYEKVGAVGYVSFGQVTYLMLLRKLLKILLWRIARSQTGLT